MTSSQTVPLRVDVAHQHRELLRAWTELVRDPARRLAQREHDDLAVRWDHHRQQHLEPR